MPAELIPIFIIGICMLVPIITILTKHQQRMAELYREDRMRSVPEPQLQHDNETLRKELADVKALLHDQAIAIDNLARSQGASHLSERLEDKV